MRNSSTCPELCRRLLRTVLLALPLSGLAMALDPHRAMSQYIRDRWTQDQGLPRGAVFALSQTPDGYLWIGSQAGLVRFDGWKFQLIAADPAVGQFSPVLNLLADASGTLWTQAFGPRMLAYTRGAFDARAGGLPYSNVTALAKSTEGTLIAAAPEQGAVMQRGGRFEQLVRPGLLPRSSVTATAQTSEGTVWIGTRDAGLYRVTSGGIAAFAPRLPDPKVNCLLATRDGSLWIGTDNGVARWDGTTLSRIDLGPATRRTQVLAMVSDRDRNLWVGTNSRGLLRINASGVASFGIGPSGTDTVTSLLEDREGSLWIGASGGIERLRDSAFVTYSPSEGIPSDGNTPIFLDADLRLWFGPVSGGLWGTLRGKHIQVSGDGLASDVVYALAGRKGEVWAGRQRGGLTLIRTSGGSLTTKTWTERDGLAQNSVSSVHVSRDGAVWAGTLSAGVSRLEGGRFTTFTTADGLASNMVVWILEDSRGTMWFATPAGLTSFANGRWRTWTDREGLPSANIFCLMEDSAGVLWVGTSAGIAFGGPHGFKPGSALPAAYREQTYGLAEDRHGSMWIATAGRVLRVARQAVIDGTLREGELREYGMSDGLRGTEGVKRNRSVMADAAGRIWFSLNRGISVVEPDRPADRTASAIVHVESLSADGDAVDIAAVHPRVPPLKQRIAFSFTSGVLSVPERVRFRYMLEGFDRSFSEPGSAREAVYTNLAPGHYRFRVIAANADGHWDAGESSLSFQIEPAFWQTWLFRLAALMGMAASVMVLWRLRLARLTKQMSLRFEERLAERTRIAQELHDTLLQGFISASMQLHVTADQMPDDSPPKRSLGRVLGLVNRVIEDGRNAVRGLRSRDTDMDDPAVAFSRIREELGTDSQCELRVLVEGQPRPFHPLARDEVYRIGREAIVNALRHAQARKIEIALEYGSRQFRLQVRDDGRGIDSDVLRSGREGHWGLPGMRERAEKIGGRLQLWSSPTAGTEVELAVPNSIAFGTSK